MPTTTINDVNRFNNAYLRATGQEEQPLLTQPKTPSSEREAYDKQASGYKNRAANNNLFGSISQRLSQFFGSKSPSSDVKTSDDNQALDKPDKTKPKSVFKSVAGFAAMTLGIQAAAFLGASLIGAAVNGVVGGGMSFGGDGPLDNMLGALSGGLIGSVFGKWGALGGATIGATVVDL